MSEKKDVRPFIIKNWIEWETGEKFVVLDWGEDEITVEVGEGEKLKKRTLTNEDISKLRNRLREIGNNRRKADRVEQLPDTPNWARRNYPVIMHFDVYSVEFDQPGVVSLYLCPREGRTYKDGFYFGASFCSPFKGKDGKVDTFSRKKAYKIASDRAESRWISGNIQKMTKDLSWMTSFLSTSMSLLAYTPNWLSSVSNVQIRDKSTMKALGTDDSSTITVLA